jgi:hypothetical protein
MPAIARGPQQVFLLGAGFNLDAKDERGAISVDTLYGPRQIDVGYPLVADTARLCFDLTAFPPGKSIEDLFSDAAEQNDYSPLSKLAHCLRQADYYIALPLASREKSNCYREFFDRFAASSFLTFNYDSFPETFLFRLRLWYPHDGYGVRVAVDLPPGRDEFAGKKSSSLVLHLHGTLCVRTSEHEIHREPGRALAMLVERERPVYAFDPNSISSNFAPFHRVVGDDDVSERIIAPVPDKADGLKRVFVREIRDMALPLLRASGNAVAVGYSFNDHDRRSYEPLLRALGESHNRRLLIVSPDALPVAGRLRLRFPELCIEAIKATFKHWVAASFPGVAPS